MLQIAIALPIAIEIGLSTLKLAKQSESMQLPDWVIIKPREICSWQQVSHVGCVGESGSLPL